MKRRRLHWMWIVLWGAGVFLGSMPMTVRAVQGRGGESDVLIYGATPGGVMAAVTAARAGHSVILVEYTDHIGGIVSNGLTNADIARKQAVGGIYAEFRARVKQHYTALHQRNPTAQSAADLKLVGEGYRTEAHVAERIFNDMVDGEGGRIQRRLRHELKETVVVEGRLTAVVLEDRARPGSRVAYSARVFIDGTYEGDLAAMAGAPYRTGREGRTEYGEPHAGRIYMRHGLNDRGVNEILPGSTGEADNATEAYCFRLHITNRPENRVPLQKPRNYDRADYAWMLEDIRSGRAPTLRHLVQLIPVPGGKFQLNSDHPHNDTGVPAESLDLAEDNWEWPEATPARRDEIYERYLTHNVGLIWLLQNDPEVPMALRTEAGQYGWCKDEFADHGHVPRQVYVRQGRRVMGEYVLTERDAELSPPLERSRVQTTSIGVVEWAFDSHGVRRYDPAHPGVREGYTMVRYQTPFQIPYGVLVPLKIDGLLVPVACSCSHVAYNGLRMEPVFMALGEVSGLAAHLAIRDRSRVRDVEVPALQRALVERGGVITFYHDVKFNHPAFAAFQWLGARGLAVGYYAEPDRVLSRAEAAARLARVLHFAGRSWTTLQSGDHVTGRDLQFWLEQAGYRPAGAVFPQAQDQPLTASRFAQCVYAAMAPVGSAGAAAASAR